MNRAYLCLGGNLGDAVATFAKAIAALYSYGVTTNCKSSIYISAAWGMENAPEFFNQVIEIETKFSAPQLMQELLRIEHEMGRERHFTGNYESRNIDIDIILFGDAIIHAEHLHIPHPRMHLRRFVLEPLAEIAPQLMHPVLHKTIAQLLQECPDTGHVKKIAHVA